MKRTKKRGIVLPLGFLFHPGWILTMWRKEQGSHAETLRR